MSRHPGWKLVPYVCLTALRLSAFDLVPLPQELTGLKEPPRLLPADTVIVLGENPSAKSRLAADEIDARVRALGGPPPAVTQDINHKASFKIHLGTQQDNSSLALMAAAASVALPDNPQGYTITFVPGAVLLLGSDPQGALYAAATLRQMLRSTGAGKIELQTATIRDWPDFQWRLLGKPPRRVEAWDRIRNAKSWAAEETVIERWLVEQKRYVDWCLRNKINYISHRTRMDIRTRVEAITPTGRQALRALTDYARARGVYWEATAYSAMGPSEGEPADWKDCLHTHGVTYCYSREADIRRRARILAQFAKDAGISLYYLHAPDMKKNDFGFGARCTRCRQKWNDRQRAAADAWVMALFCEELRKLNPALRIACVLRPYALRKHVDILSPREQTVFQKTRAYWAAIHAGLPPDTLIVFRETIRPSMRSCRAAFPGRGCYLYNNALKAYGDGWVPLFSTTIRYAKTFFFNDARDVYFAGSDAAAHTIYRAAANHYAWNVDAPGAALQPLFNVYEPFRSGQIPPIVANELLFSICRTQFGPLVGPLVAAAVEQDVAWTPVADPVVVLPHEQKLARWNSELDAWDETVLDKLADYAGVMKRQSDRSSVALPYLEKAARMLQAKPDLLDGFQRAHFDHLFSLVAATRLLSSVRHAHYAAEQALNSGGHTNATSLATNGLVLCDSAAARFNATLALLANEQNCAPEVRHVLSMVEETRPILRTLAKMGRGLIEEEADTAENLKRAQFLLAGPNATVHGAGNGTLEFTDTRARTPGRRALLFTPPSRPHRGCRVLFDSIDIRPFAEKDGYLRFYVNSAGPHGAHRATLSGIYEDTNGTRISGSGRLNTYVRLHIPSATEIKQDPLTPGFVTVDGLTDTWQLVSVPLRAFVPDGGCRLAGLHLNFTTVPECGLLIADPYVIEKTETVRVERRRVPVEATPKGSSDGR